MTCVLRNLDWTGLNFVISVETVEKQVTDEHPGCGDRQRQHETPMVTGHGRVERPTEYVQALKEEIMPFLWPCFQK